MKRLSPVDASFLYMESEQTPMHVGLLLIFKLPEGAPADYLQKLMTTLRGYPVSRPPFNHVLKRGFFSRILPAWEIAQDIDLDYHLRHNALPAPGGERELGVLISRLHSHKLDLSRPPWECHVIEGLENRRFAIYLKGHHSAVDGMAGLRILKSWLSEDPKAFNQPPPWAMPQPIPVRLPGAGPLAPFRTLKAQVEAQLKAFPELLRGLRRASTEYPNGSLSVLFKAPSTLLNSDVSGQRRFATQNLKLTRFKAIAERCGGTVNDVALAVVGSALRRYLLELDALPRSPLTALVPVGQRPRRGQTHGNTITGLIADLETHVADPVKRLEAICANTRAGKQHLQSLSRAAVDQYTMLLMAPLTLGQVTRSATYLPPLFNLIISNIVGHKHKLYFNGAEMEGLFPVSLLFRGQALTVVIVGYADTLTISFTACRRAVPSVQRLAVYAGDALNELEQALGMTDTSGLRVVSIHSAQRARRAGGDELPAAASEG